MAPSSSVPPFGLLTVRCVAHRLGVSESSVRRLIRYRHLGVVRIGRSVRIHEEEVLRFQAANSLEAL